VAISAPCHSPGMARSTHAAGSPSRLVGYLLLLGGLGVIALSVQTGRDNYRQYRRNETVDVLRGMATVWDWLLPPIIVGGVGLIMLIVGWIMVARAQSAARLLRNGDAARARVVEAVKTGRPVNGQPSLRITLLIDLPGHSTYAATTRTVVPTVMLGRVQPGTIVAVRVDPRDPQRVVLDWAGASQA
jgi:hypothetical protein